MSIKHHRFGKKPMISVLTRIGTTNHHFWQETKSNNHHVSSVELHIMCLIYAYSTTHTW